MKVTCNGCPLSLNKDGKFTVDVPDGSYIKYGGRTEMVETRQGTFQSVIKVIRVSDNIRIGTVDRMTQKYVPLLGSECVNCKPVTGCVDCNTATIIEKPVTTDDVEDGCVSCGTEVTATAAPETPDVKTQEIKPAAIPVVVKKKKESFVDKLKKLFSKWF